MLNYEEDIKLIIEKMDYLPDETARINMVNAVLGMLEFS